MRKLNILKMMSDIDDKFIKLADEDFDTQSTRYGVYMVADKIRFPWRAVLASVICTAAVCCTAFLLVWKNGVIEIPTAANNSNNSETNSEVNDIGLNFYFENNNKLDLKTGDMREIHIDSAFAFSDNGIVTRYDVGDKIGGYNIIEASSVFSGGGQTFDLIRQEITLEAVENISDFFYSESDNGLSIVFSDSVSEHLGLPVFSKNTQLDDTNSFGCPSENISPQDGFTTINAFIFKVIVDYEVGRITYSAQEITGAR